MPLDRRSFVLGTGATLVLPACAHAQPGCAIDPPITEPVPGRTLRCFHPVSLQARAHA